MTPEEISDIEKWAKYDNHTVATLQIARTHCLSLINALRIQMAERKAETEVKEYLDEERIYVAELYKRERAISRKLAEAYQRCPAETLTLDVFDPVWCPENGCDDEYVKMDKCWLKHAADQVAEQQGDEKK